jgi:TrmH family RNA methyltransferase
MKTMNIRDLFIVSNEKFDPVQIKHLAIHAFDVYEKSTLLSKFEDAVLDLTLVAGITRRRGKRRKYFALLPEELAARIAHTAGTIGLVFGNEESGLSENELAFCDIAVKIPSSRLFPSLNLSHAVQIITYTIYRTLNKIAFPYYTPVTHKRLSSLTNIMITSLKNVGFFTQGDPDELRLFLKDIYARAQLSGREAARLEVIYRKISGLIAKKGIDS